MSVVFKTTVDSPSTHVVDCDAMAAVPIDQQALLNALGDAMGMLAAEERIEREQQVSELREKTAALEGKVGSPLRGNGIFTPETKKPKRPWRFRDAGAETKSR
jgi:hypothetical protein